MAFLLCFNRVALLKDKAIRKSIFCAAVGLAVIVILVIRWSLTNRITLATGRLLRRRSRAFELELHGVMNEIESLSCF